MTFLLYTQIGLIYSLVVFIFAELSQGLFSDQLGLTSLYEVITDIRVILAFLISLFLWPGMLAFTIYTILNEVI